MRFEGSGPLINGVEFLLFLAESPLEFAQRLRVGPGGLLNAGQFLAGLRDLLCEGGQLGAQTVALAACLPGLIGKQCQLSTGR